MMQLTNEEVYKLKEDCDDFVILLDNLAVELLGLGSSFLHEIFRELKVDLEAELYAFEKYFHINNDITLLIAVYITYSKIEAFLNETNKYNIAYLDYLKSEAHRLKLCFSYQNLLNKINNK